MMSNKLKLQIAAVVSALGGSAFAASSVTYDFQSSAAGDLFTDSGVAGWSQDTTNPKAFGQTFPLAYVAATNFGGGSSVSAHLGTQQSNTPDNADTTLTGSLSSLDPIYNMVNVSFNLAVLDDSADSYDGRDNFNIALTDASGAQAATIGFTPSAGNNEVWDIAVGVNGSTSTTPQTISANSGYSFYIESRDNLTTFSYGAGDGSGLRIGLGSFNEKVTSLNSITGIAFEHDPLSPVGTSAHTLAFDNVSVQIPEPSSSLLMVLSAGLIAVRRRR
ncbi:PEP-CTERM sorting domain-containing protein [Akkermansiaceae bacterium]|nr:PEP-CTERM sorting domain-containing protein [Akkermansiaceae bacterium]